MLWPEGLTYSHTLAFFEPANTTLFQDLQEFLNEKLEIGRGDRI